MPKMEKHSLDGFRTVWHGNALCNDCGHAPRVLPPEEPDVTDIQPDHNTTILVDHVASGDPSAPSGVAVDKAFDFAGALVPGVPIPRNHPSPKDHKHQSHPKPVAIDKLQPEGKTDKAFDFAGSLFDAPPAVGRYTSDNLDAVAKKRSSSKTVAEPKPLHDIPIVRTRADSEYGRVWMSFVVTSCGRCGLIAPERLVTQTYEASWGHHCRVDTQSDVITK